MTGDELEDEEEEEEDDEFTACNEGTVPFSGNNMSNENGCVLHQQVTDALYVLGNDGRGFDVGATEVIDETDVGVRDVADVADVTDVGVTNVGVTNVGVTDVTNFASFDSRSEGAFCSSFCFVTGLSEEMFRVSAGANVDGTFLISRSIVK